MQAVFFAIFSFFGFTQAQVLQPEEFKAIVDDHQQVIQTKKDYNRAQPHHYFHLGNLPAAPDKTHKNYLVVNGQVLTKQKGAIDNFLCINPDVALLLDVQKNDGFVDNDGILSLRGFFSLEEIDYSPKLIKLWVSNRRQDVTKFGEECLGFCDGLQCLDFSGFTHMTEIGRAFLFNCKNLKRIDLSALTNVTAIGGGFLFYCFDLQRLDLSGFTHVTSVGDLFLYYCCRLQRLDLSCFIHVTEIGDSFLENGNLTELVRPELTNLLVLRRAASVFRESNDPAKQEYGAFLYQNYLLSLDPAANGLIAELRLDRLKAITPKALESLNISGDAVVERFTALFRNLSKNNDHGVALQEKQASFNDHFLPMLRHLFVNTYVRVTWPIRDEYKTELQIAFQHMFVKLEQAKPDEAISYLVLALEAYEHCESRYISATNQVLMQMGLSTRPEDGLKGVLETALNDIKKEAYMNMRLVQGEEGEGAHHEGRQFTVVNNAIGLPVAIRGFQEKISKLSNEEMQEILQNFVKIFFNKEIIVQNMLEKTEHVKVESLRSYLGQMEARDKLQAYIDEDDIDGYHKDLAGLAASDPFNYKVAPFTKGEMTRLLVLIGVVKE